MRLVTNIYDFNAFTDPLGVYVTRIITNRHDWFCFFRFSFTYYYFAHWYLSFR